MEREPSNEASPADDFEDEVRKALGITPEERAEKILALCRQIEERSYHIPLEWLARRLLEAELLDLLDSTDD